MKSEKKKAQTSGQFTGTLLKGRGSSEPYNLAMHVFAREREHLGSVINLHR